MMGKTYTTTQVAKRLKRNSQTIKRYCSDGIIPGVSQKDGCYIIPEESLNQLIQADDKNIPLIHAFEFENEIRLIYNDPNLSIDDICSLQEASNISGWADSTLQQYCKDGAIPSAHKIWNRWFILKNEVYKCKEINDHYGSLKELMFNKYADNISLDDLGDFIDVYTASAISGYTVSTIRWLCRYRYVTMENGKVSKDSLIRFGFNKERKNESENHLESSEPDSTDKTPVLEPAPEPQPTPAAEPTTTIQGHELRLESVDAFDLYTQAYDALFLICKVLGGRTDKDMTAVYTDFDDIRKNLALHRSDIEEINDYTYTLVYLDGNPNPAAFPVRKQSSEGAVV